MTGRSPRTTVTQPHLPPDAKRSTRNHGFLSSHEIKII